PQRGRPRHGPRRRRQRSRSRNHVVPGPLLAPFQTPRRRRGVFLFARVPVTRRKKLSPHPLRLGIVSRNPQGGSYARSKTSASKALAAKDAARSRSPPACLCHACRRAASPQGAPRRVFPTLLALWL